jgi:proteasome accessory factor B
MQQNEAGSAADLASLFHISERTLYRDLQVLGDLGIPCYHDPEQGRYRIRRDYFLPPVQLTASEALALTALAGETALPGQIALTGPAARALEKIKGQLPAQVLQRVQQLEDHIEIRLPPTGTHGDEIQDVYSRVQQAIATRRALKCAYESLNHAEAAAGAAGEADFFFEPYALTYDQRAWYTIGRHDGRDAVRQLKLSRFTRIELTDRPYEIPADFSIDAFRGGAWRMIRGTESHEVAIDFDAKMAETVQDTQWHRTQTITYHDDGSLTFHCQVEGLDEIVWWVLGYGPYAKVRQPEALARRVAQLALQTASRYEQTQTDAVRTK